MGTQSHSCSGLCLSFQPHLLPHSPEKLHWALQPDNSTLVVSGTYHVLHPLHTLLPLPRLFFLPYLLLLSHLPFKIQSKHHILFKNPFSTRKSKLPIFDAVLVVLQAVDLRAKLSSFKFKFHQLLAGRSC